MSWKYRLAVAMIAVMGIVGVSHDYYGHPVLAQTDQENDGAWCDDQLQDGDFGNVDCDS